MEPLLSVSLGARFGATEVLKNVEVSIGPGEILGLVGESGSGKSTLALALLRLLHLKGGTVSGSISLAGRDLMALSEREMTNIRGRDMALVLQSPVSSLNPMLRIATQLKEAWKAHQGGANGAFEETIRGAMHDVVLPSAPEFLSRYPSQLSVGQAQRVLIAMALLHHPALLIADEPTSALDMITASEILSLFRSLRRRRGLSLLFISHDLLAVASISDRIAVLRKGTIIECRDTRELLSEPQHPYTRELIRSLPVEASALLLASAEQNLPLTVEI